MESDEDVAFSQFEVQKAELLSREQSIKHAMQSSQLDVESAREALRSYEEAGRAGHQKVLEIADNKAHAESDIAREEMRMRELKSLKEEFERGTEQRYLHSRVHARLITQHFLNFRLKTGVLKRRESVKWRNLNLLKEAGGTGESNT